MWDKYRYAQAWLFLLSVSVCIVQKLSYWSQEFAFGNQHDRNRLANPIALCAN